MLPERFHGRQIRRDQESAQSEAHSKHCDVLRSKTSKRKVTTESLVDLITNMHVKTGDVLTTVSKPLIMESAMPDNTQVEQEGRPFVPEKPSPQEKPTVLKIQEIKRIASAPTREQLRQLASTRAKERDQEEYKGGYEAKDMKWARRLTQRYERAYAAHEHLREEAVSARNAAKWGDEDQYNRWQQLKSERDRIAEKVNLLSEPFRQSGVSLDKSQIPPTFAERMQTRVSESLISTGEALVKPVKAVQAGIENVINTASSRVDTARAEIAVSVGEKLLALKGARDRLTTKFDQLRTELSTAVGDAVGQKKREISDLVASSRVQAERAGEQAVGSTKLLFEKARQRAVETLGPFAELVRQDRELIRTKATAATEQVGRAVEANRTIAAEFLLAVSQQASEKAGAALGLPQKGLEKLREVGGKVVDEFNQQVKEPIAEEFLKRKEIWGLRTQSAKARLNRMIDVYGDAAGPVFNVGKDAVSKVTEYADRALETGGKGLKVASEVVKSGKERVSRTYEGVSDFVVNRATELWSKTEGLSQVDVSARAALLKARLANISRVAQQVGLKVEEAAAFGVATASLGVEAAAHAMPQSTRGRLLLAGGLAVGGIAALAVSHPDAFQQMSEALGQLTRGYFSQGTETASQVVSHAASMPEIHGQVASQIPNTGGPEALSGALSSVSPSETETLSRIAPSIPTASGTESLGSNIRSGIESISGAQPIPNIAGVEAAGAHVPSFTDFLNHTTTIRPGDTLWETVKGQTADFGQWVNPETGVDKGDVVADIVRKFMRSAGSNPDLIHPGETFSLSHLNLSQEQLNVIQDTLKSTSFDQYKTEIMPKFETLITKR